MIRSSAYHSKVSKTPGKFNMAEELATYEQEDHTTGGRELACTSGQCEL